MYEATEAVKDKIRQLKPAISYYDLNKIEEIMKFGPFLQYGSYSDSSVKASWLKKRCNKYRQKLSEDADYKKMKEHLGDFAKELEDKEIVAFDDTYDTYRGIDCSVRIWLMKKGYHGSPNIFLIVSSFNKNRYRATIIIIDNMYDALDYFVGLNILKGLKIVEMWWDMMYILNYDRWRERLFNNLESWEYVNKRMIPTEPKKGKIIGYIEFKAAIPIKESSNTTDRIESGKLITSDSDKSYNMMKNERYNPLWDEY